MCTFLQRTLIDLWGMNSLYKTMKNLAWCIIFAYISNNSAILLMSNTGLYPSKIPATHFNNRNHHLLHFHSSGMQVIGCRWETSGCMLQLVVHLFRICISLELSGEKCGPASNSHLTLHAVATQGNLSFHGFAIVKAHSSKTASGAGYSEVILYSYESNWNENCEKARRGKKHNVSLEDHVRMLLSKAQTSLFNFLWHSLKSSVDQQKRKARACVHNSLFSCSVVFLFPSTLSWFKRNEQAKDHGA